MGDTEGIKRIEDRLARIEVEYFELLGKIANILERDSALIAKIEKKIGGEPK